MNKFFTLILVVFGLFAADWVVGQEMVLVKEEVNSVIIAQEHMDSKWFFFEATSTFSSKPYLWVTDGTKEGTVRLLDDDVFMFRTKPQLYMGGYQGMCYFAGKDEEHGIEVWRSDGTKEGTQFFADLAEGIESSHPAGFVEFNGFLYIWAYIKEEDGTNFCQLWRTDGMNIEMIKEISVCENTFQDYEFTLRDFTVRQDEILFTLGAESGGVQFCLWKTDGTSEGTIIVTETDSDGPGGLITANDDISYFVAIAQLGGYISNFLWHTDGTPTGTYPLESAFKTRYRTVVESSLYYLRLPAFDEPNNGIWKTDGDTPTLIKSIPEESIYSLDNFVGFDKQLFFVFEDEENGREIWVSDGSESGTRLFEDIHTGEGDANPRYLKVIGDALYFVANYSDENYGLYRIIGETVEQLVDFKTTNIVDTQDLFAFGEEELLLLNENSDGVIQLWSYNSLIDNIQVVNQKDIVVQPNPFNHETHINFQNPTNELVSLQLYTVTGQQVKTKYQLTTEGILLEKGELKSGMYFFDLLSDGKKLGNGKLVVD